MRRWLHASKTNKHPRSSSAPGQSLVEFSVMLVLLSYLLLGVLDMGRAYFTYIAMMDAAGEGATFASVNPMKWCNAAHDNFPTCPGSDYESIDPDNIAFRVVQSAPEGSLIDWNQTTVDVELEGTLPVKPGRRLTVTLTTNYQLLTPFIGTIVGSQILPLRAQASAVVLAP